MDLTIPKVSIITACYNSAGVIEEAMLSVLNQAEQNIEYIVIDGGSTDGTVEIIKKYADKLSFWVSEPDQGISNAWNKALQHCTGDFVGILNADDLYLPGTVETVVKSFQLNPQAGFVFGDSLICDLQGKETYLWQGDPEFAREILYEMPSIPHPSVFVRREVYQMHGGFAETFKTAMDYEFLLRIWIKGVKGLYVPRTWTKMRLGGESDRNFARAYREVMEASVKYGYSSTLALCRYYYCCLKTFTRKKLQNLGLDLVVKTFRKLKNKRYKYLK